MSSTSPSSTLPERTTPPHSVMKRIVVFCDGTWQDGLSQSRVEFTNIMRLARSVHYRDHRDQVSVPQIVYYLSGVGTGGSAYSRVVEGTTGGTIVDKIEAGYGFIAQNYHPGDEIFLFGFSRGAYTARMIAILIGQLGILDRKDMDNFAKIFETYVKMGECEGETDIANLKAKLSRWTDPNSAGRRRANHNGDGFTIKCLGVFDTVSSVGLPEEISLARAIHPLFGLREESLSQHVERAYHALALDESRADFNCIKFVQTDAGRQKGQLLKQCWFSGCHSDVGGGYPDHDLADIALMWMAAQVSDMLSLDMNYLASFTDPVAPWGKQTPHNPRTGVFSVANVSPRAPPSLDIFTQESIHPSVLEKTLTDTLKHQILTHPELIYRLTPLEEKWKSEWPYDPNAPQAQRYKADQNAEQHPASDPASDDIAKGSKKTSKRDSWIFRFMKFKKET